MNVNLKCLLAVAVVAVAPVVAAGLIPVLNVLQTESEEVWALAEQTTPGRGEETPGHGLTTGIILPSKYRYTGWGSSEIKLGCLI